MTEKEMFVNNWQREFGTTLKVLKNMPADKAGFRPAAEKARSAKELGAVFIQELGVADSVVKGKIDFFRTAAIVRNVGRFPEGIGKQTKGDDRQVAGDVREGLELRDHDPCRTEEDG